MDYVEQIPSTDLMYGPGGNLLKVVIVPTPLDAQVIIEAGEYVPVNNVVYVPSGTSIIYTVVKNGYIPKAAEIIVTESQNIYVELEKEQENMIYGWSTGASEAWSTPVSMGVRQGSSNIYWTKAVYGKNKFVVLDSKGYISISINGINWSSGLLSLGDNRWVGLAFDGVKFLALGQDGAISTSEDGLTWGNVEVLLGSNTWVSVAYGDGKFVALSSGGKITTSLTDDGMNWSSVETVSELGVHQWMALVYDGNKFVALSYTGYVSISEDGINWTEAIQHSNLREKSWRDLVYCNSKFTALGWEGYISTSEDGLTWSEALIPANLNTSGRPDNWISIAYGNGEYIALGFGGYVSELKLNSFYSQVEYPVIDDYLFDSDGNIISRVVSANEYKAWEFSKDGINFTGYTTSIYPSSGDTVYSDTSGTTSFTVEGLGTFTLTVGSCDYKSITVVPSTIYDWSSYYYILPSIGGIYWASIAYGKNKYLVISRTGYFSSSLDGMSWSTPIQNADLEALGVRLLTYGKGKFIAIERHGGLVTSIDGENWSEVIESSIQDDSYSWTSLYYDGYRFIVLGYSTVDNVKTFICSTSLDGENWEVPNTQGGDPDVVGTSRYIAYGNGRYVRLTKAGYVSWSTNFDSGWSGYSQILTLSSTANDWSSLIYDGYKFIAISLSGVAAVSLNGVDWVISTTSLPHGSATDNYFLAYNGYKTIAANNQRAVSVCQSAMKMKREPQLDETSSLTVQSYVNIADWKEPVRGLPVLDSSEKNEWFGLAYDGYKYVALNKLGYISTSVDGEIWTQPLEVPNLGGTHNWQYLLYDGLKYIALAADGYIATSTDGIEWGEAVSALDAHSWENLAFDGTTYVAVSATGWRAISSDGVNWSYITQDSNLGNYYWFALTYGNGKFVALGKSSYCAYSSEGTLWQKITVSNLANHTWNGVVWDGTKFLAVATDGYVAASPNGTTWDPPTKTSLALSVSARENEDWDKIIYDGKRLLAVSQEGYVSTETNVINRDKTLDKVSKNKIQYFTVSTDNTTSITFNSVNNIMTFPNSILIDWGDGSSEIVSSVPSVSHSYSNSGYYRIKITSGSGLLPDITSISNLYSWDSILLPMIKADGISYADVCQIFYEKTNLKVVCSSLFKNTMYSTLQAIFTRCSGLQSLVLMDKKEVQSNSYAGIGQVSGIKKADFSKLNYATSAFGYAFQYNNVLQEINFDSLISVYGVNFQGAFRSCPSLTSVVFPVLESIQGSNCFISAFLNDINLTEVKFPSLKYINGDSVFSSAFASTAVTDLYFPSLSPVNVDKGQFNGILEGNDNLKIHFPINLNYKFSVGKFVIISEDGFVATSNRYDYGWNVEENANLHSYIDWVALNYGNGNFVALTYDGFVSTSLDGETWSTPFNTNVCDRVAALTYDGNKFVALSDQGSTFISTNGTAWNIGGTLDQMQRWVALTYGKGKFVAVSDSGFVSTSPDGETWTSVGLVFDHFYVWEAIIYGNNKFVVMSQDGFVSMSEDGITWTSVIEAGDSFDYGWKSLSYDGFQFLAFSRFGDVSASIDGESWTYPVNFTSTQGWVSAVFRSNLSCDLPSSEE